MKTGYWLALGFVVAGGVGSRTAVPRWAGTPPGGGTGETGGSGAAVGGADDRGSSENGGADTGGPVSCDADLNACGSDCVDFDKDAKNCGACSHDCLGGTCTLGVCQPLEIANGQGRLMIVELDDKFIYWGGDEAVVGKKNIDNTGQITTLVPASGSEAAYFGALTGSTFFWVNGWKDNGVRGCVLPTCAGGPSLMIPATTQPDGIAYSEQAATLYWTQKTGVWHKLLPAGDAEQFVPTVHTPFAIKTDESFVYWVENDATTKLTEIRKIAPTGGSSSSLVSGFTDYADMATYGKTLFLLVSPIAGGASIGTVSLPNGIGSASPKPFAAAGASCLALSVDESGVYWAQRDGMNGTIRHCPLTGCSGNPEILAPTTTPWGITTDAKAIYWTTEDGFVMKLAK